MDAEDAKKHEGDAGQQEKDAGTDASQGRSRSASPAATKSESAQYAERLRTQTAQLPIANYREDLVRAAREEECLVVIGETGSGKTTQLPQYLLDAGLASADKPIIVTQPRRVAAISVSQRVAEERGSHVGAEVGYRVRFDACVTEGKTRIEYVTDGLLLRECLADPELKRFSYVILDEAHIRSLDTDILFGLLKANLDRRRKDRKHGRPVSGPKVIIMSATLHSHKFQEFFHCKAFRIPGRTYPVKNIYCNLVTTAEHQSYHNKAVDVALTIHKTKPAGDILVFLTGRSEIDAACDEIFRRSEALDYDREVKDTTVEGLMVVPCYGTMTTGAQKRIFDSAPQGVRKVVVATEIASTSLTVEGIVYVVDSGFVKQSVYNPKTGLDALQVVPISRSEAKQRAGRAGRTRPGECYRLYTRDFEDQMMEEHTTPEIQRTSLTSVVLTLKCLGIDDVLRFDYLDAPEEVLLLDALRQLFFFDALDIHGKVTDLGRKMADLPVSPPCARILLAAIGFKEGTTHDSEFDEFLADDLAAVVSLMSVEECFIRPRKEDAIKRADAIREELATLGGGDDFGCILYVFRCAQACRDLRGWCRDSFIHMRVLSTALRVYDQLKQILKDIAKRSLKAPRQGHLRDGRLPPLSSDVNQALRRALCYGLFHNVARRAEGRAYFTTLQGTASVVSIHPSSALFGKEEDLSWVIFHEVKWTSKPYMHRISPIQYSWVQNMLPKLHKVELTSLSSAGEITDHVARAEIELEDRKRKHEETIESGGARRNTSSDVEAARQRYLARKRAKLEGKGKA